MDVDRSELQKGLARTSRYVLSHHEPHEWYRCYAPSVIGRRIHVCARCLGIYPGIVAGVLAYLSGIEAVANVLLVAVLPLPALVDWAATSIGDRRGFNPVRTTTGALLGFGYGLGLGLLFGDFDLRVLGVGVAYVLAAGASLAIWLRREPN